MAKAKPLENALLPRISLGIVFAFFLPGVSYAVDEDLPNGAGGRAWAVTSGLSVSETYTDNFTLTPSGQTSEFVTEVSPFVRVDSNSARLRAHLDYRLSGLFHANDSEKNRTQNALNAFGRLEAIEDHLFVEFSGNISQQTVSAFGLQGSTNTNDNDNVAETSVFRISPYLIGRLGNFASYELRYSGSRSNTESNSGVGTVQSDWSASLGGSSPGGSVSWLLFGQAQQVRYGDRPAFESDEANARITWRPDTDFALWVSGGREANDYASITKTSHSTSGGGLEWAPGQRTRFAASREKRFFGDSDNAELSHRTAKTIFKLGHSESVSVQPNQLATVTLGSIYDLLFAQFASLYPDPVARAAAVNQFLLVTGIPPGTQVTSGFLTTRVSKQKSSNASFAWLGVRNTITLGGVRTDSEALSTGFLGDDFDNFSVIRQTGVTLSWAHNLSPLTSLNATVSRQVTTGEGATASRTSTRSAQVGMQTKAGPNTGLSFSIRRAESDGASGNYIENSAVGTLSHKF